MTLKQRVATIVNDSNFSKSEIAKRINVPVSTLTNSIKEGTNREPKLPIITGIMVIFPEINPRWLILGEGEMIEENTNEKLNELYEALKNNTKSIKNIVKHYPEAYEDVKHLFD